MKKILPCLILLLAMLPFLAMDADAATVVDSGYCGNNLSWVLDKKGTLTISGTGDMWDVSDYDTPWQSYSSSIHTVVIEPGVTTIGAFAFYRCDRITSVYIPEGVYIIRKSAFEGCTSLAWVTLPEGLTYIGEYAFHTCRKMTGIYIPNSVTHIGYAAFYGCSSLESVTIPANVTEICFYAFKNCSSLTSVSIPEGVTRIRDGAFSGCGKLAAVSIPTSLQYICESAFSGCSSLTWVTLPQGLIGIDDYAFAYCRNLTGVNIPGSVHSIDEYAFTGCTNLAWAAIFEGVTWIGASAFSNCTNLTGVTIPKSVTYIRDYAFSGCTSLTEITIPDGVSSIRWGSFSGCSSLTYVFIPESVTSIDSFAFDGCASLTDVYYNGTVAQWDEINISYYNERLTSAYIHTNETPFMDVFSGIYYYEPILWALSKNITAGIDATHFAPDATCTRGQIVTFLWRANGSPEPKNASNPFRDVSSGDYFYKAVLWAVENGITSGMGDGSFAPNAPCTRGQVATFLWRSKGQPASSGGNGFYDVTPGAYYYDAVLWAVANGVTNGMGNGSFAPDAPCTRGQIVTFLYRAMK